MSLKQVYLDKFASESSIEDREDVSKFAAADRVEETVPEEKTAMAELQETLIPEGMTLLDMMEKVSEEEPDPQGDMGDMDYYYAMLTGEVEPEVVKTSEEYDIPVKDMFNDEPATETEQDEVVEVIDSVMKTAGIPQKKQEITDAIEREHPEYSDEKTHKIAWSAYKQWKENRSG